ncbi:MAG: glycosyltransferase family 2 protein [Deltaproteobacteria bacterium]|nr:MAG: glycosyltransferase family 2 protein [Deltaproteobacteria bacterium]
MPDRGKGDAISHGIKASTKNIIVQLDADLQFLPEEIPSLIQPLLENRADMTLGSRFMKHSIRNAESVPGARLGGNFVVSLWCSFLYGQKITDALAGFKAWKRGVTASFDLTSFTYSYEVELFAKAIQKKWRVVDVPISTCPRKAGVSTVSVFSSGLNILKDAVRFCFY